MRLKGITIKILQDKELTKIIDEYFNECLKIEDLYSKIRVFSTKKQEALYCISLNTESIK